MSVIAANYKGISSWANVHKPQLMSLSMQRGNGKGTVAEINSINSDDHITNTALRFTNPKQDAIILLKMITDVAKLSKKRALQSGLKGEQLEKISVPVSVSWAAPHAAEMDPEQTEIKQAFQKETARNGFIYQSNIPLNQVHYRNRSKERGFDLKEYLIDNLAEVFGVEPSELSVEGKLGDWTFKTANNPSVHLTWRNDGNLLVESSINDHNRKPNKIYAQIIQGGGGNINIAVTGEDGAVTELKNTEAFGKPLSWLGEETEKRTLFIHGKRTQDRLEKWTASGDSGIKDSVRYLRELNATGKLDQLKEIFGKLELDPREAMDSPLLNIRTGEMSEKEHNGKLDPWITRQAQNKDPLALALEKDLLDLTYKALAKTLTEFKAEHPNHQLAQVSYNGGAIKGRLQKLGLEEEIQQRITRDFNPGTTVNMHEPDLDGARTITHAGLLKAQELFRQLPIPSQSQ